MLRPPEFGNPYLTVRHTPYQVIAGPSEIADRSSCGGVIKSGELLWTKQRIPVTRSPRAVLAFVDEIGTIAIDPRVLQLADAPFS
ncbi:MAG: hypothetical protein ACRYFU_14655 [Janthinobacterium lividum]